MTQINPFYILAQLQTLENVIDAMKKDMMMAAQEAALTRMKRDRAERAKSEHTNIGETDEGTDT